LVSKVVELGPVNAASQIAAPQLCARDAQEQTMESFHGRVPFGSAASQAAHPLGRFGIGRSTETPTTSDQTVSDHHRADSSLTENLGGRIAGSVLSLLVQPPANARHDVGIHTGLRPGKLMQPVEHPLQGDKGSVALRADTDVALEAPSAAGR
jgi:hypothetical protein